MVCLEAMSSLIIGSPLPFMKGREEEEEEEVGGIEEVVVWHSISSWSGLMGEKLELEAGEEESYLMTEEGRLSWLLEGAWSGPFLATAAAYARVLRLVSGCEEEEEEEGEDGFVRDTVVGR